MKKIVWILIFLLVLGGGTYFYIDKVDNKYLPQEISLVDNQVVEEEEQFIEEDFDVKKTTDINSDITGEKTDVKLEKKSYGEYDMPFPEKSRISELTFDPSKPTNYTDPMYSNIVGYNSEIGITMSISTGVSPSTFEDGSLGEVWAIRFEDSITGVYNDVFAVFSCFDGDKTKLRSALPQYLGNDTSYTTKDLFFNGISYKYTEYGSGFMLTDLRKFEDNLDCGLVFAGRELSEVHVNFLQNIKYIESRDKYFENIYNLFKS